MPVPVARIAALSIVALALSACSSLSLNTAQPKRGIDYVQEDVASLLMAFDLPVSLEPIPGASAISFDLGARHLRAVLGEADADDAAGSLPPPADGRNYYLFAFADADRQAIRDLQAAARSGGTLAVTVIPALCRTEKVDPAKVTFSVLAALPGATSLSPLIQSQTVGAQLATTGATDLPACTGHSG